MDQSQRLQTVVEKIREYVPLVPISVDTDISDNRAFLKLVNVTCKNWSADKIPKVGALQFSVKLPALDALNIIVYPKENSEAPIFLFFFLLTGRKVICHFNVNTPFVDDEYLNKWVRPLDDILAQYPAFDCHDRYPDWMKQYRHSCTIYGLFGKDRLEDLTRCSFAYLDAYLSELADAQPVKESERLQQIAEFHQKFKDDIRTRDKAQGMTAKFIGKEKAKRIFYEVVT